MQGPIEQRYGPAVAILITGTMFAIAHLDFTLVLWLYYVAVAAIYGAVTYLTKSILPAVVLHTGGNLYSNFDLWLRGRAEWRAPSVDTTLASHHSTVASFSSSPAALTILATAMLWAYFRLRRAANAA
jgi:membrane protease YdiL (CAAX protease family)